MSILNSSIRSLLRLKPMKTSRPLQPWQKHLAEVNAGCSSSFRTVLALGSNGCSSDTGFWWQPNRFARLISQIGRRLPMTLATAANNISLQILSKYWGKHRGSIKKNLPRFSFCYSLKREFPFNTPEETYAAAQNESQIKILYIILVKDYFDKG